MYDALNGELVALLPRLRRYGRSITGNISDADDLVQAACEKVLRADRPEDPGFRFDLWVLRIMRNHWLDHVRSAAHRTRAPAEDAPEAGDEGLSARQAEDRLMLNKVRQAMARLTPEYRDVLALVAIDGLSYREAAETLNVPQGTIMSRLARARRALAAELA